MSDPNPRRLAAYGLALLALIVLALWYVGRGAGGATAAVPDGAPAIAVQGESKGPLVVHVAGAVRHPGVYRMRAGSRVDDAVARAGGPRRRADLSALNLAAELEDGRQVLVPLRVVVPAASPGAGATSGTASAAAVSPTVPLNLNTATPEQLDELDGIGPATAQHIIEYREEHDGFSSVEELDQVPGIGETRLAALRDKVRV